MSRFLSALPSRQCLALLAILSIILGAVSAHAQDFRLERDARGAQLILRNDTASAVRSTHRATKEQKVQAAESFVQSKKSALGLQNATHTLEMSAVQLDDLDMAHVRFKHLVNGVPVFGSSLIAHVNPSGEVTFATLSLAQPPPTISVQPKISKAQAIQAAKQFWAQQGRENSPQVLNAELSIVDEKLIAGTPSSKFYLAWAIDLHAERDKHQRALIFITQDNYVLGEISQVNDDRVVFDCSIADQSGGNCFAGRQYGGGILGRREDTGPAGLNPIFGTADNDKVFDTMAITNNYYATRHGRNGANGVGGISDGSQYPIGDIRALTYIDRVEGVGCPNAFYDGIAVNFCNLFGSQTEVVGHELSHALTRHTANLIYKDESGALNESFSDIFGNAVDVFNSGDQARWTIGDRIGDPRLTRDMANPPSQIYGTGQPYPDHFQSANYYCGTGDNGGVHGNSSVMNKGAYLIAAGGVFNGCTITGLGREKMEKIAYRALTVYLQQSSGFNQAFNAYISAASDLYGAGSVEAAEVTKALMAVEMNQPGKCSGAPANQPRCDSVGGGDPNDQCPADPAKTAPGVCGCGVADVDANANGVVDCQEPVSQRNVELLALDIKNRMLPSKGGIVHISAVVRNVDLIAQANVAVIEKRSGYRQAFPMAALDASGDQTLLGTSLRFIRARRSSPGAIHFQMLFEVYLNDGRYGWADGGEVVIRKKRKKIWVSH